MVGTSNLPSGKRLHTGKSSFFIGKLPKGHNSFFYVYQAGSVPFAWPLTKRGLPGLHGRPGACRKSRASVRKDLRAKQTTS